MTFRPIVLTATMDPALPSFERRGEPVAVGVACPRGVVPFGSPWSLTDQCGRVVRVQTTTLDRWGDGSVRWLLTEFRADVAPDGPSFYALAPGDGIPPVEPGLAIEHDGEILRVDTGSAVFEVPRCGPGFLGAARVSHRSLLASSAITAEDERGGRYAFVTRRAVLERAGDLRAVIVLDGHLLEASRVEAGAWLRARPWLDARVRLTFFAGLGTLTAEVEVTNTHAARHPGGAWDLGDAGSVLIRDLSVEFRANAGDRPDVWGSIGHGDPMEPSGRRFTVYQDSSGGTNWQHVTHANREGRVPFSFRGFRAVRGGRLIEGLRATPIASIGGGDARVSIAVPKFWQLCPKALEAHTDGTNQLAIGVFPRVHGDLHELQGGERTTLTLALCFGRDTVSAEPLAWIRAPLRVTADPMSYQQSGAWAPITLGSRDTVDIYDALVTTAINGPASFERRRDTIDEYGWRNFGELFADHECLNEPLVSHYNNQYDAIAGFLTRYMQTADHRWSALASDLAVHVADIDLYHTTRDRSAYNGGYFWHTQHYQAAGTATHRAYSRRSGSSGGGPCSEHNYTTGFMLHHFLTGSEKSRAAVIQLANWVIDMDDGRKSRFRWIDRRDTGLASVTRSPDFHGPGRGAGNSINALLDAHRLTGVPRYLAKAEALIARCVHPDDDPAAIDPLDAENRWSYTVFLQALGKYLDYRADHGLIDAKFEYARAALVKWALWMSAHERPYLDTPEKLEYPTETWAAQDIRKAAVFEFAERHVSDESTRAVFRACANRFFDYAVRTLQESPTGRLTRPLVLLLAYGFQRPLGDAVHMAPAVAVSSFRRESFTPLRQRLARKLAWAGAGLSAAAVFVIVLLIS